MLASRPLLRPRAVACRAAATPLGSKLFRADGFSKYELEETDAEGATRVRVDVGDVGERSPQSYVFRPVLAQPSKVFAVTLPRPLGAVFVPDSTGAVRLAEFVPGSTGARAAAVARLSPDGAAGLAVGDLLRATTSTIFAFTPAAQLVGELKDTKRTVVLFGCDNQAYSQCFGALTNGLVADGPVCLVLERAGETSPDKDWKPMPFISQEEAESGDAAATERLLTQREPDVTVDGGGEIGGAVVIAVGSLILLVLVGFF